MCTAALRIARAAKSQAVPNRMYGTVSRSSLLDVSCRMTEPLNAISTRPTGWRHPSTDSAPASCLSSHRHISKENHLYHTIITPPHYGPKLSLRNTKRGSRRGLFHSALDSALFPWGLDLEEHRLTLTNKIKAAAATYTSLSMLSRIHGLGYMNTDFLKGAEVRFSMLTRFLGFVGTTEARSVRHIYAQLARYCHYRKRFYLLRQISLRLIQTESCMGKSVC
jgi:hypothetical protein